MKHLYLSGLLFFLPFFGFNQTITNVGTDFWVAFPPNWTNEAFAASPLKYSGFSGFNALLSGSNHMNRQWDYPGFATFYWSSVSHGPLKAWAHGMNEIDPSVSYYPSLRTNAFSVRCLKD